MSDPPRPASSRAAWLIPALGLLAVLGAERISSQWQGDPDEPAETDLYREVLFYTPPESKEVSIQSLPIEDDQVGYLTHDRGRRWAFFDRKSSQGMELLYLEYDGNNPRFFFDLFNHPPERCMASTGAEVTARHDTRSISVGGADCLLQGLEVTAAETGEKRFIFKLTWVHPDHPLEYGASIHLKRIQAALATIPPPPARLLMAGLYGFETADDARAFFREHVTDHLATALP